jgi:DNA-binding transcriptional LysR family regulator
VPEDPRFELRHLRYFIVSAEYGSFRRAAEVLGIRASAVSRRIRDLEGEVGGALFIRHSGGVKLTYAGEQFVSSARQILKQIGEAAYGVRTARRGEDGVVRIGIFSSLASGFLAELFQAYNAGHAGVRLDFFEGGPDQHLPAIRQHKLDIAFLIRPPLTEGCDTAHLWDEHVYVVMSEADPLANQKRIEWGDLRNRHFVISEAAPGPELHNYLVTHLAEPGRHPSIQRQDVYRDTLMHIVAGGRSLTLTSEATVATQFPGVVFRPLAKEMLSFCAIWSPQNDNPALKRLLSLAKVMRDGARPAGL